MNETIRLVLLGGAGHASDVLAAIEAINETNGTARYDVIGLFDDGDTDPIRFIDRRVEKLGSMDDVAHTDATHFACGVGYPNPRRRMAGMAEAAGLTPATIVHPCSYVAPNAVLGAGTIVLANASVSPCCRLGRHSLVSYNVFVGHDCRAGDFATIMPAAAVSGDVTLGDNCLIGSNATVLQGVTIGSRATVGAGGVAVRDIPDDATVKGVPAR